jgi:hypothetical protein
VPGFVSGLIHAGAVGATGYAEGQDENQRKMLALAQQRRAQQREDEEADLKRIDALAKARDAGLTVTPQASERSGDTFGSVGTSIRGVAGPAEEAKPTRVGTVAGMDITVPDKYEPKAVRDKRAAIEAGVEKPPEQTLEEYDRVHGIETQVTTPSAKTAPATNGTTPPPPANDPRLNRTGDALSPADQAMAAKDPKFRAWLISKGKLKGP